MGHRHKSIHPTFPKQIQIYVREKKLIIIFSVGAGEGVEGMKGGRQEREGGYFAD